MTYPEDPSQQPQQPPQQPGFPPPPPPPQDAPSYPPPQDAPSYPPPPQGGTPSYPLPPQGGAPSYPPPPPAPPYGYGQGAAGTPPGMFFDPQSGLTLPAGVELASVGRRIGAYFLSIVLAVVTLGIGWVIWGLIIWGRGQTPALQVLGMRVWRPESQSTASFGYMALREIIGRIVDGILSFITGLISFILMVSGKERKTLHDMVAGTVVLYDPNKVLGH